MDTPGVCLCDNWVLNEVADAVLEAMPMIAQVYLFDSRTSEHSELTFTQISCYVLMSSLKFVLNIGAQFIPIVGKALDAGLGMSYCTGSWWLVSPLDNWPPDKETQI